MKYKYTVFTGIIFGVLANVIGGIGFPDLLGTYGIGLGALATCCGCLLGYTLDKKSNLVRFIRVVILAILFFVIDEGINILYEKITNQICEMGVSQLIIGLISLLLTFLCDKGITYVQRKQE